MNRSLLDDEDSLIRNFTSRAAALFPFWINEECDTYITFQNYWKWKRETPVTIRIVIHSSKGVLLYKKSEKLIKNHFEISVSKTIKNLTNVQSFGQIEIEILSDDDRNIVFPFPAMMVYYTNGHGKYSCVHSAGRTTINENECRYEDFSETNFNCTLDDDFSPFFHLFTGNKINSSVRNITLKIFTYENEHICSIKIPEIKGKNISKTYYLKDLLIDKELKSKLYKNNFFAILNGECLGIYPRFIVGNHSIKEKMHYVTHSFREIKNDDLIKYNKEYTGDYLSSIALATPPEIKLKWKIYPTCGNSKLFDLIKIKNIEPKKSIYNINTSEKIFKKTNESMYLANGEIDHKDPSALFTKVSQNVPSRINCGLEFRHAKSTATTDIALQFTTFNAKPKINFWGHLINNQKNYKSYFILNNILPQKDNQDCSVEIEIVDTIERELITIKAGTSYCFEFNKAFHSIKKIKSKFISWKIKILSGRMQDMYVITIDDVTGNIFGDHSF